MGVKYDVKHIIRMMIQFSQWRRIYKPRMEHMEYRFSSIVEIWLRNVSILRMDGRWVDNSLFSTMVSKVTGICSRMNKMCFNEAVHSSVTNSELTSYTGNWTHVDEFIFNWQNLSTTVCSKMAISLNSQHNITSNDGCWGRSSERYHGYSKKEEE